MGLRLLRCRPGFVQTVNVQIVANEIRVNSPASGIELQRLLRRSEGLIVIAQIAVDGAQVDGADMSSRG